MNKRQIFAVSIGFISLVTGILAVKFAWLDIREISPVEPNDVPPTRTANLSGPFTHKNLTIFLVHGETTLLGKTPLTLEEALEKKLAVIHETSDVNELAIENVSKDGEIYVQSGDIVKGGQQDRVLGVDLIVPARSGRMPIDAFCVEHGRWTQRGIEPSTQFSTSTDVLASKDIKLAAKKSKSQTEVWHKVDEEQTKLSEAANSDVRSNSSRSSLQLSLENREVRESADEYIQALSSIVQGSDDVIGFVFAINGKLNSGDTYTSTELFKKLWPRLLKASAIEAVSESSYSPSGGSVLSFDDIESFLVQTAAAPIVDKRIVTDRITMISRETEKDILLETLDTKQKSSWIHRNYITK